MERRSTPRRPNKGLTQDQTRFIESTAHSFEEAHKDQHLTEKELKDKALELAFLTII